VEARSKPQQQRWSLVATLLIVLLSLSVTASLLIGAVDDLLPDVPGLDYRMVQGGIVLLALLLCAYTIDRERGIRKLERTLISEQMEVQRLEMRDELKNAFMRSVSHDLRSPLTAILTGATILEKRGEQLPADQLREAAAVVGTQARRLEGMLSDLLDVERLATGEVSVNRQDVDLQQVLRTIVDGYGIRDRVVSVTASPGKVSVDPRLLDRIVENLVRNAVKYTPRTTPIRIGAEADGPTVVVTVEDEGPGVPDAIKEDVFEPFNRGTAPEGVGGTGVGLSIVRQFAELHGGRAWVEDRPGGGARFKVVLSTTGS